VGACGRGCREPLVPGECAWSRFVMPDPFTPVVGGSYRVNGVGLGSEKG